MTDPVTDERLTPEGRLREFVRESNRIEGILREPTDAEVEECVRFLALKQVAISDLKRFVSVYQPDAVLRDKNTLNVRVGNHIAPMGGRQLVLDLTNLLGGLERDRASAYRTHREYERLHPFTDGNGRSGRMLWLWQMRDAPLGFLHHWYYQALEFGGR